MTKPTRNAEVTEISLEELESVGGGVTLIHEDTHVRLRTHCAIVDNPPGDLFMMCWRGTLGDPW
jgi:hypothetical protein